ncbi:MAG: glycogen synthase [Patescibacteria group bacterium]
MVVQNKHKHIIKKVLEDLITDSSKETPEQKLKILMVAAEATPYASVGGIAMVIEALSRALIKRGHDVRIFMPKFGFIDEEKHELELIHEGLIVPTDDEKNPELICNVKLSVKNAVPTYFLENHEYYEKRANVYGYSDDPTRWALLSRGVLEFIKDPKVFVPDVIHAHDWHTGCVPNYLKTVYSKDDSLSLLPCLFTIHNLSIQGMNLDHMNMSELDYDDGRSPIASFFSPRINKQNFMKRGIIYADAVNAVSKTYSKEILTPDFGQGLDKLLLEVRSKLFGIINGINYETLNPATDPLLEKNFTAKSIEDRIENKTALQEEFDLRVSKDIPLLGFVGRVEWQKGVDLIARTLEHVMKDFEVQFVHVGGGDGGLLEMLRGLQRKFPDKVGIHPYPNFTLPRLVFGGSDVILFPSRFEPCGIVQIEAMRYGALPLVRKVGGLADTVQNFDVSTGEGTGFVFTDFNEFSLFGQIVRAIELYRNKEVWQKIQINAMSQDFSWEYSAGEYERLYKKTFSLKHEKHPREGSY